MNDEKHRADYWAHAREKNRELGVPGPHSNEWRLTREKARGLFGLSKNRFTLWENDGRIARGEDGLFGLGDLLAAVSQVLDEQHCEDYVAAMRQVENNYGQYAVHRAPARGQGGRCKVCGGAV